MRMPCMLAFPLNPDIKTEILSAVNWIGQGFLPEDWVLDGMLKKAYSTEQKPPRLPFGKDEENLHSMLPGTWLGCSIGMTL